MINKIYKILFSVLIVLSLLNCAEVKEKNNYLIDQKLLTQLNKFIVYADSLDYLRFGHREKFEPNRNKSIWLYFFTDSSKCKLKIINNFNYYNSKTMDGYFIHQGKTITVYNSQNTCGKKFVTIDRLNIGKISYLECYEDENTEIFPHDPPFLTYEIIGDKLNIIKSK